MTTPNYAGTDDGYRTPHHAEYKTMPMEPMIYKRSRWRYLHLLWLFMAWTLQYMFVVPTVWLWRYLAVPAFKLGFIGVMLLFIPIIGWIILAMLIFRRPATPTQKKSNDYAKPWGVGLLK